MMYQQDVPSPEQELSQQERRRQALLRKMMKDKKKRRDDENLYPSQANNDLISSRKAGLY